MDLNFLIILADEPVIFYLHS